MVVYVVVSFFEDNKDNRDNIDNGVYFPGGFVALPAALQKRPHARCWGMRPL